MTDFFCVEDNMMDSQNSYMLISQNNDHILPNENEFENDDDIENQNDNDNDEQPINVQELNSIREKIESMPKFNQIEVLRILNSYKEIILNENKYGVLVNMSDLKQDVIEKLKTYISYVNTQESNLNEIEVQKEEFKNIYFLKDNKDINSKNNNKYV